MGTQLPQKGAQPPIFGPCLLWPNGCMHQDTTCGTEEGLSLGDIVLDGDSAPPRKGAQQPPPLLAHVLWPNGWMDQDTTWYGRRPQPRLCVRCGPSPFHFWPMSIVAKRSPSQQLLSSLLIYCWELGVKWNVLLTTKHFFFFVFMKLSNRNSSCQQCAYNFRPNLGLCLRNCKS